MIGRKAAALVATAGVFALQACAIFGDGTRFVARTQTGGTVAAARNHEAAHARIEADCGGSYRILGEREVLLRTDSSTSETCSTTEDGSRCTQSTTEHPITEYQIDYECETPREIRPGTWADR